jgi:hypothetical protein
MELIMAALVENGNLPKIVIFLSFQGRDAEGKGINHGRLYFMFAF